MIVGQLDNAVIVNCHFILMGVRIADSNCFLAYCCSHVLARGPARAVVY